MVAQAKDPSLAELSQRELGNIVEAWTTMSAPRQIVENLLTLGKAAERFENAERMLTEAPTMNNKALAAHLILNPKSDIQRFLVTGISFCGGDGVTVKLGDHKLELRNITDGSFGPVTQEIYGSVDGQALTNAEAVFAWKLLARETRRNEARGETLGRVVGIGEREA